MMRRTLSQSPEEVAESEFYNEDDDPAFQALLMQLANEAESLYLNGLREEHEPDEGEGEEVIVHLKKGKKKMKNDDEYYSNSYYD